MGRSKRKKMKSSTPVSTPSSQMKGPVQVPVPVSLTPIPVLVSSVELPGATATPTEVQGMGRKAESVKHSVGTPAQRSMGSNNQLPVITRGPEALRLSVGSPSHRGMGNYAGHLKTDYMAKVAAWAAANVPPLGALLGQRLASTFESAGIPCSAHSFCQRCESLLQPGINCVVRETKVPRKWKKMKIKNADAGIMTAIGYECQFCKYENKKPGPRKVDEKTRKAQLAALAQLKKLGNTKSPAMTPAQADKTQVGVFSTPLEDKWTLAAASSPASVVSMEEIADSTSKKRKRQGWSSLKTIATLQMKGLSIPQQLGFPGSPLNPKKK